MEFLGDFSKWNISKMEDFKNKIINIKLNLQDEIEIQLFDFLSNYLMNELTFNEFESKYYNLYMDSEYIDFKFSDFHTMVCEKLDYTIMELDDEAIKYGWINEKDFKCWLLLNFKKCFNIPI